MLVALTILLPPPPLPLLLLLLLLHLNCIVDARRRFIVNLFLLVVDIANGDNGSGPVCTCTIHDITTIG